MDSSTFAYIRVSSRDQNEARQLDALAGLSLDKCHVIVEKQSGRDFDRPKYKSLLRRLKPGDTLILHSLDRLGRNYDEILEQWRLITREKQADIRVLDFPLLDTRGRPGGGDLTGRFVSNLVLEVLAYVAHKEREDIRRRQAEGIASARARGVHFGRRAMTPPEGFSAARDAYRRGELTSAQAAGGLGVSRATFLRWNRGERGAAGAL